VSALIYSDNIPEEDSRIIEEEIQQKWKDKAASQFQEEDLDQQKKLDKLIYWRNIWKYFFLWFKRILFDIKRNQITNEQVKLLLFDYVFKLENLGGDLKYLKVKWFLEILRISHEKEDFSHVHRVAKITPWFPIFPQELLRMIGSSTTHSKTEK